MIFSTHLMALVASQGVKVVLNGVSFFLLARQLGVVDFGWFITISALCTLLAPVVDMGLFQVNLKRHAQGEGVAHLIGASIQSIIVMSLVVVPLCLAFATMLFDFTFLFLIFVAIEILVFEKILLLLNSLFACEKRFGDYSRLEILHSTLRFFVVILLWLLDGKKELWGWLFFLHGAALCLVGLLWLRRIVNLEFSPWNEVFERIKEGFYFLISTVFEVAMQELDRIIVARLAGVSHVGVYGAIMRINNMVLIPINSYYITVNKDIYDLKEVASRWESSLIKKIVVRSFFISLFLAVLLLLASPFFVMLLGADYAQIEDYIYLSVMLPIAYALAQPLLDGLSARGFQKQRNFIVGASLFLNIAMMYFLVPIYQTGGAIFSILVARFFVAFVSGYMLKLKFSQH